MNNTRIRKKKKRVKLRRFFLLVFLILISGVGVYSYNVYSHIVNAVDNMHQPIDRDKSAKREERVEFEATEPLSILVVGVDERDGDFGRTDSMLVVTINPKTKSTKILSIPRDTRTEVVDSEEPSNSFMTKINHAYAYGGIEMTIDTVENFLNVPIDYYTEVNMKGFKDIVDAVGGINVNNQYAFELDGVTLEAGQQHLDGEEALQYARMRKEDPLGDFGRQARQREVLSKVINKGKSLSTLTNYDDVLEALQENVKTNLTLDEIIDIQLGYKSAIQTIEKIEITGEGTTLYDGIWYFLVDDETRQTLSDELRTHLELPTDAVVSINEYQ
ncbi:LCP family glycopolymer transferase [Litchfieldia salsa]|uniref:Cell envelope-related function transcriptional attenuator common domain-containing protein n=1 Tax=Litchfieldia salsa TaxID=930152 RepID=A0A1H0WW30_9BACI|nr:LCP family protein [Litchfieldia salsa]SDP94938.1 cell envelope-related function transcriptional attenuator common domain-containing protein [Litchfieldia salsa]